MRFSILPIGILLLGSLWLSGCLPKPSNPRTSKRRSTEVNRLKGQSKNAPAWQTRLGRIVLVNNSQEFVLIDSGTAPVPEPGTRLRAYANGELSAELSVSVHQQRPFLIADIVSGTPRVSDMVVPIKNESNPEKSHRPDVPEAQQEPPTAGSIRKHPTPDPSESTEIPQIERRPPPPSQSLLTPSRPLGGDSDAIIPGLPSPGKNTPR